MYGEPGAEGDSRVFPVVAVGRRYRKKTEGADWRRLTVRGGGDRAISVRIRTGTIAVRVARRVEGTVFAKDLERVLAEALAKSDISPIDLSRCAAAESCRTVGCDGTSHSQIKRKAAEICLIRLGPREFRVILLCSSVLLRPQGIATAPQREALAHCGAFNGCSLRASSL
jgi:hypothetical protein